MLILKLTQEYKLTEDLKSYFLQIRLLTKFHSKNFELKSVFLSSHLIFLWWNSTLKYNEWLCYSQELRIVDWILRENGNAFWSLALVGTVAGFWKESTPSDSWAHREKLLRRLILKSYIGLSCLSCTLLWQHGFMLIDWQESPRL